MHTLQGADLIIKLLERQGITTVAGIPGGSNLPLYDALSRSQTIRHVLTRHEQGAGFMAQGMARSSGQPGVCFATSGPGATNVLTAIADAFLDSIPVICITGQVPGSLIGTDAFQEVDTYGMSIPITKHNFLVRSAAELLEVIPAAFRIATSGRPGPVLIDIPKDVQMATVDFETWPEPGAAAPLPELDQKGLQAACQLLDRAKQPILYLGGGVIQADAGQAARQLAEKGGIPCTMTLMGLGALPADHPLNMGMLGMHAARSTNMALEECDLLIAAGVRFDDRATGKINEFCPKADIIHIDIDPSELSKLKTAHVGLTGDVGQGLSGLTAICKDQKRQEWLQRVNQLRQAYPMNCPDSRDLTTPYGLILGVADLLEDGAIISTDVGKHQMWTAQVFPFMRPRQLLTSGGLGTMGFGMPAAIGASLAFPQQQVVCFSGDGSLMMNIQEMATAVEQQVNIKIIVMNNNSLGLVRQQQELFYNKNHFASEYSHQVDFPAIARGFGMAACDLGQSSDPQKDLAAALQQSGPCLIHAPIDIKEEVYPMVPPGAANKEMIGGHNASDCR